MFNFLKRKNKRIYLDNSASTKTDPEVFSAMKSYWMENFGNPSSIHKEGIVAKKAISDARERVARILGCRSKEIIFTSGGTEADNLAIVGIAMGAKSFLKKTGRSGHIIITQIEHHAILAPAKFLEEQGFSVTYISVKENGIVDPTEIKKALRDDTVLVSVMYANNEVGTVQPIEEIAKIVRKHRSNNQNSIYPYFHTDACQAVGYLPVNVLKLGVDLMTLSGSKIYCAKGVGALFVKDKTKLSPILRGGNQEFGFRSGTETVPYIVGFAKAVEISENLREKESKRLAELRDYFIKSVLQQFPKTKLNGDPILRLPNNINLSFDGIEGEQLVIELDAVGVAVSAGSACATNDTGASHTLFSMYKDYDRAKQAVRFSLGRYNAKEEIDFVLKTLPEIISRIS